MNTTDNNDFSTNKSRAGNGAAEYEENTEKESMQPEGGKQKAVPHTDGSHKEGQYDKQSDKPTMQPGSSESEVNSSDNV